MTHSPAAERAEEAPAPLPAVSVSPGVGRLLHGSKDSTTASAAELEPAAIAPARPSDASTGFIRGLMIAADFLLIAMACALAFKSNTPFGFLEILLCSVAIGMGAVLSCIAVLWKR